MIDGFHESISHFNRHLGGNVVPFKLTQVKIHDDSMTDYVNADYVASPITGRPEEFISAQSPNQHGTPNFWKMIFLKKISLIIMLCSLTDSKCEAYFPLDVKQEVDYGDFKVTLDHEIKGGDFSLTRIFIVKDILNNEEHTVTHVNVLN